MEDVFWLIPRETGRKINRDMINLLPVAVVRFHIIVQKPYFGIQSLSGINTTGISIYQTLV